MAQPSLSGYMISSSPRTLPQFRSGIVHFLAISCVDRYRAFRSCIAREYTPLLIQTAIVAVKALNGVGGVNDLPDVGGELKDSGVALMTRYNV